MALRRRAYEPGHRPKLLVIVDDTPECERAVLFAARRVRRSGARTTTTRARLATPCGLV